MRVVDGKMPMPSNFKSQVRERMEKTGESWQTAARNVRNQVHLPGRFEAIVLRIIDLAKKRNEEREQRRGEQTTISIDESLKSLLEPMPPCKAALHQALKALSMKDVRKVEVLMYSGRDGDDVFKTNRTLRRDDHAVTVSQIRSKSPLDKYLSDGLAQAKRDGVDLEGDFRRDAEPDVTVRYFSVYWDREVPAHAGAAGLLQIESLTEGSKDVSSLVDQGLFFSEEENRVDRLRKLLAESLGCSIDEIEIDEPNEEFQYRNPDIGPGSDVGAPVNPRMRRRPRRKR